MILKINPDQNLSKPHFHQSIPLFTSDIRDFGFFITFLVPRSKLSLFQRYHQIQPSRSQTINFSQAIMAHPLLIITAKPPLYQNQPPYKTNSSIFTLFIILIKPSLSHTYHGKSALASSKSGTSKTKHAHTHYLYLALFQYK